jgi:hypothetical protein
MLDGNKKLEYDQEVEMLKHVKLWNHGQNSLDRMTMLHLKEV